MVGESLRQGGKEQRGNWLMVVSQTLGLRHDYLLNEYVNDRMGGGGFCPLLIILTTLEG